MIKTKNKNDTHSISDNLDFSVPLMDESDQILDEFYSQETEDYEEECEDEDEYVTSLINGIFDGDAA